MNDKGNGVKDRQKANKYKRKRKKNHVWEIDKQLAVAITETCHATVINNKSAHRYFSFNQTAVEDISSKSLKHST